MKINESNYDTFYDLQNKGFDIDIIWKDAENIDGYIEVEKMYELIQDLKVEIGNLEEELEDTKVHYEQKLKEQEEYFLDNYKPISKYEEFGINENDFH